MYSQFINTGILLLALALEQNGISRYGSQQLLDYSKKSPARKGRYAFISGRKELSPDNQEVLEKINHPDNRDGSIIKVVLGSPIAGEGLDFKCVREIHLLEPWFHMNRVEQVIGRGIRNQSHFLLPEQLRNVTVYLHASVFPDHQLETVDMYMYRLSEKKMIQMAMIEKMIKSGAIDCQLNKKGNQFKVKKLMVRTSQGNVVSVDSGDVPKSRGCHYLTNCEYTCDGITREALDEAGSDSHTYNMTHARLEMDIVKKAVKIFLATHFMATLDDLTHGVVQSLGETARDNLGKDFEILYYTIQDLLDSGEIWIDRYGRKGKLIYRSGYYLFQPSEYNNTAISKQIRETPIPWKQQDISIPLSLFQSDEGREVEKDQEELQESVYELIKKLVSQFRERINSEVSRREQQANEFSTTFRPVVARVSSDQFELVTLCRVLDHLPDKTFKMLIAEMSSGKINGNLPIEKTSSSEPSI